MCSSYDPKENCICTNASQLWLLPLQPSTPVSPPFYLSPSSEYHAVESSVLRVVHQDGQRDAADDGGMSALTTVAREILQDAAEQSRAALGELLGGEGGKGTPWGE